MKIDGQANLLCECVMEGEAEIANQLHQVLTNARECGKKLNRETERLVTVIKH